MSPKVARKSRAAASTALPAVRVDLNTHGEWEIQLPDQSEPVTCEMLEDAQRVAYLYAAHRSPCELIVNATPIIASFTAKSSTAATISHPPTSSPSRSSAPRQAG
jgi:hypothetical protein